MNARIDCVRNFKETHQAGEKHPPSNKSKWFGKGGSGREQTILWRKKKIISFGRTFLTHSSMLHCSEWRLFLKGLGTNSECPFLRNVFVNKNILLQAVLTQLFSLHFHELPMEALQLQLLYIHSWRHTFRLIKVLLLLCCQQAMNNMTAAKFADTQKKGLTFSKSYWVIH